MSYESDRVNPYPTLIDWEALDIPDEHPIRNARDNYYTTLD